MENQQQIVLDDYRSYLQDHSSIIGSDPEILILPAVVHGDLWCDRVDHVHCMRSTDFDVAANSS